MFIANQEMLLTVIHSDKWPKAVPDELICRTDEDKKKRARGILGTVIDKPLEGCAFLDFGGEDFLTEIAVDEFGAQTEAPYDVILIYDVLDHCEEMAEELRKARKMLAPNGKIYLRLHPYTSRHATHVYHTFNKAYIHLFLQDKSLAEHSPKFCQRIMYPRKQYGKLIRECGLKIQREFSIREKIEKFFLQEPMSDVLKQMYGGNFPTYQLEQQFVDYVLKKAPYENDENKASHESN
jgi:hypothetical protein